MANSWSPTCMLDYVTGEALPNTKWRVLKDDDGWFYIQCKSAAFEDTWNGGISGTKDFLGLTDEEARRAYTK